MKRRTFDVLVSAGAVIVAVALGLMAVVFHANADFAKGNVREQLVAQKISFPPASALSAEEKAQPGVVKFAGQQVTTGDQARAFANEFIALHLRGLAGGKTYSQLSAESRANPQDQAKAQLVQTAFRGETLRGLLLTSYAFWTLGQKADDTALILIILAGILFVGAAFGFWHASETPKREELRLGSRKNGNGIAERRRTPQHRRPQRSRA